MKLYTRVQLLLSITACILSAQSGTTVGLYGLVGGVLTSGSAYLQVQRVDGTTTPYSMLLQPTGGNVGIGTTSPTSPLHVVGLPTYASDSAAAAGGLTTGAFYKDASGGLHAKL